MKNRAFLTAQHQPQINPAEMGTTGLVSWVLSATTPGLDRWQRFKRARRVIEQRGLSAGLFRAAIIATGRLHAINLNRFDRATA